MYNKNSNKNFGPEDIMSFFEDMATMAIGGMYTGASKVKKEATKVSKKVKKEINARKKVAEVTSAVDSIGVTRFISEDGVNVDLYDIIKISDVIAMNSDGKYKIIVRNPNVIIFWVDGTITKVRCSKNDTFDVEKGIAMAILNKLFGNGYYRNLEKIMNNLEVIETAPFDRKAIKKAAEKKEKAKVTKKVGAKKTENKPAKEETEKND